MNVSLPWPDRRLNPNARIHRMQRAKLVAAAKDDTILAVCGQVPVHVRRAFAQGEEPIHLAITFRPPDKRRRDLDNMLASAKALLDGFAHACQVDDHRFELTLRRGVPVKLGRVEITVGSPVDNAAFPCCSAGNVPQIERPAPTLDASSGANHQRPEKEV